MSWICYLTHVCPTDKDHELQWLNISSIRIAYQRHRQYLQLWYGLPSLTRRRIWFELFTRSAAAFIRSVLFWQAYEKDPLVLLWVEASQRHVPTFRAFLMSLPVQHYLPSRNSGTMWCKVDEQGYVISMEFALPYSSVSQVGLCCTVSFAVASSTLRLSPNFYHASPSFHWSL